MRRGARFLKTLSLLGYRELFEVGGRREEVAVHCAGSLMVSNACTFYGFWVGG